MQKVGDLFDPVLALKQKLPKLEGIAEAEPREVETRLDLAAQAEDSPTKSKSAKPVRRRTAPKKKGPKV